MLPTCSRRFKETPSTFIHIRNSSLKEHFLLTEANNGNYKEETKKTTNIQKDLQLKKYMPNLIAPNISPYSHFVRTTCINITVPNARVSHILMSKKQTDFTSALNPNNQFIKSNMLISPLIHITDTHCLLNRRNNSQIPKRCPQAVCSQYLT